jgi:hypothetical protein
MVTVSSVIIATIPRTNTFWTSLGTGKATVGITEHEFELSGGSQPTGSGSGHKLSKLLPFSRDKKNKSDYPANISWPLNEDSDLAGNHSKPQSRIAEESEQRPESEDQLQLVPKHIADVNTRVYAEGVGSRGTVERSESRSTTYNESSQRVSSQSSMRQSNASGVWVKKEVNVQVEHTRD